MGSRGGPAYPGSGQLESEYLEEAHLMGPPLHANGYADFLNNGAAPLAFYQGSSGTSNYLQDDVTGLCRWVITETAAQSIYRYSTKFFFPLFTPLSDLPAAMVRHRRFIYEVAVKRDSVATSKGTFDVGLVGGPYAFSASNGATGLRLVSDVERYDGRWHYEYRWVSGQPTDIVIGPDTGIDPTTDWLKLAFEYRTGRPTRQLVMTLGGTELLTLEAADLPADGPEASVYGFAPGFASKITTYGAGTWSGVAQSRFAVERLP